MLATIKNKKAFTLVELSIVIVVIGLIIGAVTAGSSLVRQAKVRGIITDKNKYSVAINTFKLQYDALPGDMRNASSYWPTASNGDGNGWINYGGQNDMSFSFTHLCLAGFITGNCIVWLSPKNSLGGIVQLGWDATGDIYQSPQHNDLIFTGSTSQLGILTATEMLGIDTKVDNGDPTTGTVLGLGPNPFVAGCMDLGWGAAPGAANYVLSSTVANCRAWFVCYQRNCVP